MTDKQIKEFISEHPEMVAMIEKSKTCFSGHTGERSGGDWTTYALVGVMIPVLKYVIINFGLPWLNGFKKWHDLQLARFHKHIDDEANREGLNTEEMKDAGKTVYEELSKLSDEATKQSWEKLKEKIGGSNS